MKGWLGGRGEGGDADTTWSVVSGGFSAQAVVSSFLGLLCRTFILCCTEVTGGQSVLLSRA